MLYLLDTHSLIWFFEGNSKLPDSARQIICNPENIIYLSAASLWEMAIKISIGKLTLSQPWEKLLNACRKRAFRCLIFLQNRFYRYSRCPSTTVIHLIEC